VFPVPQVELAWVVELVNEFSDPTRAAAGEQDEPYPELTAPAGHIAGQQWKTAELVTAANELHAIFDAAARGEPADGAINAILDRARPWQLAIPAGIGFAVRRSRRAPSSLCARAARMDHCPRDTGNWGVRCGVVNITEDPFPTAAAGWPLRMRWHVPGGCDPTAPTSSSWVPRPAIRMQRGLRRMISGGWPR
jgi:hypothetical protein